MTDFPETRNSLIAQLQSPEEVEAWDQFVILYRPVIYRLARRRGLQDADAQDLAQKVLVSVAKAISGWKKRDGVRFRNWLSRISKNAIINALSRKPIDHPVGGTSVQDLFSETPATEDESQEMQERELQWEFQREVYRRAATIVRSDVNAKTWQAFELTVIGDMSIKDAAKKLGQNTGTIYASRSRILKRLKQVVAEIEQTTPCQGVRQ